MKRLFSLILMISMSGVLLGSLTGCTYHDRHYRHDRWHDDGWRYHDRGWHDDHHWHDRHWD